MWFCCFYGRWRHTTMGECRSPLRHETSALRDLRPREGDSGPIQRPRHASPCGAVRFRPPGKPSAPPSHEHSDWLFLCLCRILPNGNRSRMIFPRRERSSVRALFRISSNICRRLPLKNHPVWSGMFTHPTSPYATAEPVPALPSIVCIVRTGHGCL